MVNDLVMKRITLIASAAIIAITACQKNEIPEQPSGTGVIYATMEEVIDTKTYMDSNNNIRWSEGDQITGFMKSIIGGKYQVSPSSIGETSASFDEVSGGGLNAGTELDHIIAWYPYSSSVKLAQSNDDYTLNVMLPVEQTYRKDSFGNGAFPMVAVSQTNNITFRNVCGAMKLQLKGTQKVTSVKIEGNNYERLAGEAVITAYADGSKPGISMAFSASTSVTLTCPEGVLLDENTATEFIISLPPTVFTQGFTVTVTDNDGKTYKVDTDKKNEVIRSSLLVMPEVTLENSGQEETVERWVDLGLSVLWASYNVGASSPEEYGGYYAWGETEEKKNYDFDSYIFYNSSTGEYDITLEEISGTSYDVAHVKWGDGARLPTVEELEELTINCTFRCDTYNGVPGGYVTGPNGNSIFLPFAGGYFYGYRDFQGYHGYFWSGTFYDVHIGGNACCLCCDGDYGYWFDSACVYGRSVRPVKDK